MSDWDTYIQSNGGTKSAAVQSALDQGMSMDTYQNNLRNWWAKNSTGSDSDVRAELDRWGVSAADLADALKTDKTAVQTKYDAANPGTRSGGMTFAMDGPNMGADQYYANIRKWADSHEGATEQDRLAEMEKWQVSQADWDRSGAALKPKKFGTETKVQGLGQLDKPTGMVMDEWNTNQYPWLRDQLNYATDKTRSGADMFYDQAKQQWEDYNNIFRPSYKKLGDLVDKYGSEGYRSTMRDRAMEDTQGQFDLNDAALRRQFQATGAGSGAMADALAGQAAQRAMAKVNAATMSDRNLEQMYGNGLSGMANFGLQLNQLAGSNMNSATNNYAKPIQWGQDIAKTGGALQQIDNTMKLGLGDLAIKDYSARQNAGVNWFNAGSNRINANNGTISANANAKQADNGNDMWSTVMGTFATPILGSAGKSAAAWMGF